MTTSDFVAYLAKCAKEMAEAASVAIDTSIRIYYLASKTAYEDALEKAKNLP